jgi:NAD(P) transhydrogenase
MPRARDYDLIVIGSGPAGEKGAAQAAFFGHKVAVVEKLAHPGGAAANTGTLPSKTLRETALYLTGYRQRGLFGVEMKLQHEKTVRDFLYRQRLVTDRERKRITWNLGRHHIDTIAGRAVFVDPHTVEITGPDGACLRKTADVFLIATGSTPHRPPLYPWGHPRVYDSDTILQLEEIPDSIAVVGGGVIGCEYACLFDCLGVETTLIEGRDALLPFLDAEFSQLLRERMAAEEITFEMPDSVVSVSGGGDPAGGTSSTEDPFVLQLKSGRSVRAASILIASGRTGASTGLGLETIGIKTNPRGQIEVDKQYRTAVPHIFAAGDVIGFPALASTSMEQARVAMCHAFDLSYKHEIAPILPYGIYTIPELSMAGETEESLREKKIPFVAGRAAYTQNARGQIVGDAGGLLKLLFRREDMKLLGVHMIGEGATELIHIGLTALVAGATSQIFIDTCYNYPTLAELYKYATYDALGHRLQPE